MESIVLAFAYGAPRSCEAICGEQVQRVLRLPVTGGAGFIGSALVRYLVNDAGEEVVNLDKLTYAGAGFNADAFPFEVLTLPMGAHLIAGRVAAAIAALVAPDSRE